MMTRLGRVLFLRNNEVLKKILLKLALLFHGTKFLRKVYQEKIFTMTRKSVLEIFHRKRKRRSKKNNALRIAYMGIKKNLSRNSQFSGTS
jgi:hypothetical protein